MKQQAPLMIMLMLAAMSLVASPAFAADSLGRFIFTPAQRAQLDLARKQKSRVTLDRELEQDAAAAPVAEILTLDGAVRRSDGKSTVWINNRTVNDKNAPGGVVINRLQPDGTLTLQTPQSARHIDLKVGQSVDLVSGVIEEPFARQTTKPVAPENAAAKPVPGTPVPAANAATTGITPEQKMLETQLKSALERLKNPSQGINGNAPDRR